VFNNNVQWRENIGKERNNCWDMKYNV
jgi:hypothetical protein